MKIDSWCLEDNPKLIRFWENVLFRDMVKDHEEISNVWGTARQVCSQDFSNTRRGRDFWSNIDVGLGFASVPKPLNPDLCMDAGRTLQRFESGGQSYVRTIGGSWSGDPDNPVANTRVPVLVYDVKFDDMQQLRPHEAEKLMGMPAGITDGPGITAKQRLTCVGLGWDLNVIRMFFVHLRAQLVKLKCCGAVVCAAGVGVGDILSSEHQLMQFALVTLRSNMTDDEFVTNLAAHTLEDQVLQLSLMRHWYAKHPVMISSIGSILDSGASRHLHQATIVLDKDNTVPIEGFNGAVQWTEGNGYLPLLGKDRNTGATVPFDIGDADSMEGVVYPLLSMGKMLRAGWCFHFTNNGKDCCAISPDGYTKLQVELGMDDLLRLIHTVRGGKDAAMLPASAPFTQSSMCARYMACVVSRSVLEATAEYVHDLLLHASATRCYYTLLHTTGFKAEHLPLHYCSSCAQANAQRKGLATSPADDPVRVNQRQVPAPVHMAAAGNIDSEALLEDDYDDQESDESADDEDVVTDDYKYTAVRAGRQLGHQVPRFDIKALRPFEVMFADNKDYPCQQR